MKLTEEKKKNRKELAVISKRLDKERGRDKTRFHKIDGECGYRTFVLFDGTEVSEGGWLIGRKWMRAKFMSARVYKWVRDSYATRADNVLKHGGKSLEVTRLLEEIDRNYDLSAGCAQCGGCRWFAALDADYGFCFNIESPNEGRITFEHGGCIQHSFIQELLAKMVSEVSDEQDKNRMG